jgi:hypothetical protein
MVSKMKGTYHLLILDGHSSHILSEFDKYMKEHNIIILYMLLYSSHLLQLLDIGCFSVLKCIYGTLIAQGICDRKDHVNKTNMLEIHKTICIQVL